MAQATEAAAALAGEWRLLKTIRRENHWGFLNTSDLKWA
jgi:hypothetical protein